MAELIAQAEYMEKKESMEFQNLRIQLAGEDAKSKAQVKYLNPQLKSLVIREWL